MARSSRSPRPVTLRRYRAAHTALAANIPVAMSPRELPTRVGGASGKPVRPMRPPRAWAVMSKASLEDSGPVWPKPLMEQYTSRGFSSLRASCPRPQPSMVPGEKFSTSTSALRARRRHRSCPSGARRFRVKDRLLRLKVAK